MIIYSTERHGWYPRKEEEETDNLQLPIEPFCVHTIPSSSTENSKKKIIILSASWQKVPQPIFKSMYLVIFGRTNYILELHQKIE